MMGANKRKKNCCGIVTNNNNKKKMYGKNKFLNFFGRYTVVVIS